MILAFSGYAKSGKDEIANTICSTYEDWHIRKFSYKLKQIASMLTGIPVEDFENQAVKEMTLHGWGMTVRDILQKLGTEAIRDNLHEDAWVNAVISEYQASIRMKSCCSKCGSSWFLDEDNKYNFTFCPTCHSVTDGKYKMGTNWIITDCRFPNEADAVKREGGYVIRIKRPFVKPVNYHQSEIALDNYDFDYVLNNDGELKNLPIKIRYMFKKLNIQ